MSPKSKRDPEENNAVADLPFPPADVGKLLLKWYTVHGRSLPWRQSRDPYRVWLSEIMLQQTTVAAVIPYYQRFLERFPDVATLAAAEPDEVLEYWSGLGYYSRARNLHRAAKTVAGELAGDFPDSVEGLLVLPGVGRSTAGAIASIAFDRPAPILDGNVRRVLARLFALQEPPRERSAEKKLWHWAELLTPQKQPHDYAQAIMDLGATICTPRQPACENCPLAGLCVARRKGLATRLPLKAGRKTLSTRQQLVLLVKKGDCLLVRRRPPKGLLGGMWEFPVIEGGRADEKHASCASLASRCGVVGDIVSLGTIRHVYSHFQLEAEVFLAKAGSPDKVAEEEGFWHEMGALSDSPLHGAHQKALKLLMKELT